MTEPRKILGEFVSYEEKEFYGVNKYIISYKQPNSADPSKVWKHQAVEADLTDESVNLLIDLSSGERLCVHQDKDEKGYPIIVDLTDAKDAPEKKEGGKTWQKGGGSGDGGVGAQVGNAINNAALVLGPGKTVSELESTAWEIIEVGERLKAKLLAKRAATKATGEKAAEAEKPKSRAELAKEKKAEDAIVEQDAGEPELENDDLENVNF